MKKLWIAAMALLCCAMFAASASADEKNADENPDLVAAYNIIDSGICGDSLTWTLYDDGELVIEGTGEMNYTTVPWNDHKKSITSATIKSGVTSIGNMAFYECSRLTGITLPEGIISIGNRAFSYCSRLSSLTLPDSVTSIGSAAFYYCSSLTSLSIPDGVTAIGADTFWRCNNLSSLTIPDSVTSIGGSAFYWCESLTNITLPKNITSIRASTFSYCLCLTSLTIPEGVTSIGENAFFACDSLTSITIPDGVTSIGSSAFLNCTNLKKITIPASVTFIDDGVFLYCKNLTIYGYADSTAETYANMFDIPFKVLGNVTLSGQIKVEGSSATPTTVKLMQNGTVVSQTEITGNAYSFEGVSAGTYDLLIERANHLPYTITGIPVGIEDVDLTDHLNSSISSAVLPAGDINGDKCIDLQDIILLTSDDTFNKPYASAAVKEADVNGDQIIDLKDLIIVTSARNFNKSAVSVPFSPEA